MAARRERTRACDETDWPLHVIAQGKRPEPPACHTLLMLNSVSRQQHRQKKCDDNSTRSYRTLSMKRVAKRLECRFLRSVALLALSNQIEMT